MRVLKTSRDPLARPVQTVRRFESPAGTGTGPGVEPDDAPEGQRLDDAEIKGLFADLGPGDMPILSAARAAASYAALSQRANRIIERLIFIAVDSSLRDRVVRGTDPEDILRGLSGRVDAHRVSPLALALSHRSFLPWSPRSEAGFMTLGTNLVRLFEAEVGRFALSRDWLRRGQEATRGRGGRSRMADAVQAFGTAPLLSSALLTEALGVSICTALTLLGEMTDLGLLQEITAAERRGSGQYQAWAGTSRRGRSDGPSCRGALSCRRPRCARRRAAAAGSRERLRCRRWSALSLISRRRSAKRMRC